MIRRALVFGLGAYLVATARRAESPVRLALGLGLVAYEGLDLLAEVRAEDERARVVLPEAPAPGWGTA